MQGTPACGDSADSVNREIITRRLEGQSAISARLKRAAAEGELSRGTNPADLARFITTIVHGMSIQAANGAKRPQLRAVAEMAIRACGASLRGNGKT